MSDSTCMLSDTILALKGIRELIDSPLAGLLSEELIEDSFGALVACVDYLVSHPISAFTDEEIELVSSTVSFLAEHGIGHPNPSDFS